MEQLGFLARLAMSALLLVAGAAALINRSATQDAMRSFGVPERLVGVAASVLALGEISFVVFLVPLPAGWDWPLRPLAFAGLLGAAVLCIAFTLVGFCATQPKVRPLTFTLRRHSTR